MNAPKLRFKNAEGADFPLWTMSKLGNEVQFSKGGKLGKSDLQKDGSHQCLLYGELYTFYGSIASKIFSRTDADSDTTSKKYDVVMPTSGETAEDIATATCIPFDGILYGGDLIILRSQTLYGPFLSYQINSSLKRKISRVAQGKSVVHIGAEKIKPISFSFPCQEEQQKIASFFSTLDRKIELNERKLEALEKLKKGVMQKIFSQEIRFKDSFGKSYPDWQEFSFKDLFEFKSSNSLSRSKLNYSNGYIKNIHYGDILLKFPTVIREDSQLIPYINNDCMHRKFDILEKGDIIFADTAEDYTLGKAIEIGTENITATAGLHTIVCKPKKHFSSGFLGYYLNSNCFHDQIVRLATGTKVYSIIKSNIVKTKLLIPASSQEQDKIAELFSSIDEKITLSNQKIKNLKELKKGFMQQMFI